MTQPQGFGDGAAERRPEPVEGMAHEPVEEAPVREDGGPSAPNGQVAEDAGDLGSVEDRPSESPDDAEPDAAELDDVEVRLAERTADLQRLQAEFLNYKRRVERDRDLITQNAMYRVLVPIIDVLDTVDRAREHVELEDGFATVADQLERVVTGLGLTKFGAPGDAFDPNVHEALSHIGEDPDVEVTTCKVIAKAGYRIGDRVVRAAQVLVVDPQ